ncbi:regulation of enolase 1 [Rhodoferax koreense]|uniref:Regulation of enolase 1 n=1 Tax=Rhodoferax koreensis TaxID=1842727 RepID=A0A1P8K4E9_9BURK|nr:regulation of enolase 1 [Rhodoferax koreense]
MPDCAADLSNSTATTSLLKAATGTAILGRSDGRWLNEPKRWSADATGDLMIVTDQATDFWCETHYGFSRDSGHFLGFTAPDAFTAQLRIRGQYEKLYDQAGIMVRVDEHRWVKAGIELSDGRAMLSSVLTMGQSDWATSPYEHLAEDFWIRATVSQGVLRLQVSADGQNWPLVRIAPFPIASSYQLGPMACTPERSGLRIRFSDLRITAPLGKDLHDLS